jgi:tetratricopeptide (TPR) repeat protein
VCFWHKILDMVAPPSHKNTHWLVILENGKTIGPYTTEAVRRLISESVINENSRIKKIGGGSWLLLSKEPEFFEAIMANVNSVKPKNTPTNDNMISDTVIVPGPDRYDPTQSHRMVQQENEVTQMGLTEALSVEIQVPEKKKSKVHQLKNSVVLDLQNISSADRFQKVKAAKWPVLMGVGAIAAIAIALWMDSSVSREQIRLMLPRLQPGAVAKIDNKTADALFKKARSYFWIDTVEGYLSAQNQFVSIIENSPSYLPARGYLCLVYRELWPFVQQTNAFNSLAKSTRSLDPVGAFGAYCDVARMLAQGQNVEARGTVDYYLERADGERQAQLEVLESSGVAAYRFSADPVMMSFRAELLSGLKDDQYSQSSPLQAAQYVSNIQKYTPNWVKMYYLEGRYLLFAGKAQQAAQAFEATLKINPKHKAALIEYGILNFVNFRQEDKALNYITGALNSRGVISRQLEARAHLTLARIFMLKRDNREARREAEKAMDLNPGDPQIRSLVLELGGSGKIAAGPTKNSTLIFEGDQHAREGDCVVAQGIFKAAFESDPTNGLAAMKAAKCLKTLNRPLEAIKWLHAAIKADPKLTTAYLLLADYYSERFDFRKAEGVLSEAAKKFPNQYEILRGYGLVMLRQNRLKESIGFLSRALKGYENDLETLVLLSKAHLIFGRSANDSALLQKAMSFAARSLELDRANVEGHVAYAQALATFKGLDSAISYLNELKTQFSRNVEYPLAIADLYRQTESYSPAINQYRAVIEWKPETKEAHMGLAYCLYMTGQLVSSLKSYFDAAYYDPSDSEPFVRMGVIYIESNKFQDAISPLEKALAANEMKPMIRYYLGKAYYGKGDFKSALEWAKKESDYNPKIADGYLLSAQIYAKTENYKSCAEQYQMAVGLRGGKKQQGEIYVAMARCQRQSGNLDGAQGSLDIALTLESGNPDIYREQGAIFEIRGDLPGAAAAYNKYLTLSPNAPDKAEVEGRISSLGK